MTSGVYLTIKECADILKVSEQTIRNYIKRGDLKSYKFGVSHRAPRRILESDFNEFIGVNVYKGDDTDPDTGVEQDE
jgi:excisionase family DNA binding protein